MTNDEKAFQAIVRSLNCVICREFQDTPDTPASIHHIAEGSAKRSEYMVAPLCPLHHMSKNYGFHGSPKKFLMQNNLPTEYHLLILVNKFRMEDGV